MPLQRDVRIDMPWSVEGDFASVNPRKCALSPPGGFVAGINVRVGAFVWDDGRGKGVVTGIPTGADVPPLGIVAKDAIVAIDTFSSTNDTFANLIVTPGSEITVYTDVDLFVRVLAPVTKNTEVKVGAMGAIGSDGTKTGFVFVDDASANEIVKITRGSSSDSSAAEATEQPATAAAA